MVIMFLLNAVSLLLKGLFSIVGMLPFAEYSVGALTLKFVGYGCYICGLPFISLLFISIGGWSLVFLALGVFKFIKTYVPAA